MCTDHQSSSSVARLAGVLALGALALACGGSPQMEVELEPAAEERPPATAVAIARDSQERLEAALQELGWSTQDCGGWTGETLLDDRMCGATRGDQRAAITSMDAYDSTLAPVLMRSRVATQDGQYLLVVSVVSVQATQSLVEGLGSGPVSDLTLESVQHGLRGQGWSVAEDPTVADSGFTVVMSQPDASRLSLQAAVFNDEGGPREREWVNEELTVWHGASGFVRVTLRDGPASQQLLDELVAELTR